MRNGTPAGAVSIRLAIRAGSYDEEESERGFAHFIEHMAFRSTRQAPEGSLDTRFANLGVAFGRDQNAATGLELDRLPDGRSGRGRRRRSRRCSNGCAAPPTESCSRRRRSSSRKASCSPSCAPGTARRRSTMRETARFQGPGLRSIDRDAGGTEASLRAATPAGLQAFYDRWYRPENAVLVIVGDADPEALLKAAEAAFGSWTRARRARNPGGAGRRWPERGLDAFTRSEPSLPLAGSACRIAPLDGPRDCEPRADAPRDPVANLGDHPHRAHRAGWRPDRAPRCSAPAPIVNRSLPDARIACLIAVPNQGKWREGLAEAQAELRRFAEAGPTPSRSRPPPSSCARGFAPRSTRAARAPPATSRRRIVEAEMAGRPYPRSRGGDAGLRSARRRADPGRRQARLRGGLDRQRAAAGPDRPRRGRHGGAGRRRGGRTRRRRRSRPSRTAKRREWAYWKFGKRGKVAVAAGQGPEFTRLIFRNGVALNFKQTDFQSGGVEIRVRFGHGERGLSVADRTADDARPPSLFPNGGLGKMDFAQIGVGARQLDLGVHPRGADRPPSCSSSSTLSDNVEQQMRLLAAYMTDPGFRPLMDEKLPTALDLSYRMLGTDPSLVASARARAGALPGPRIASAARAHGRLSGRRFRADAEAGADPVADRGDDRRRHQRRGCEAARWRRPSEPFRAARPLPPPPAGRARSATFPNACRRR